MSDALIIDAVRTPRGKGKANGALHEVTALELATQVLEAVRDRRVTFYPKRYEKTYLDWLGEKRDWCISRQLWWGHRIPVWTIEVRLPGVVDASYDEKCEATLRSAQESLEEYLTVYGVARSEYEIQSTASERLLR